MDQWYPQKTEIHIRSTSRSKIHRKIIHRLAYYQNCIGWSASAVSPIVWHYITLQVLNLKKYRRKFSISVIFFIARIFKPMTFLKVPAVKYRNSLNTATVFIVGNFKFLQAILINLVILKQTCSSSLKTARRVIPMYEKRGKTTQVIIDLFLCFLASTEYLKNLAATSHKIYWRKWLWYVANNLGSDP